MPEIQTSLVSVDVSEASRSDNDRIIPLLREIRNGIRFLVKESPQFKMMPAVDGEIDRIMRGIQIVGGR